MQIGKVLSPNCVKQWAHGLHVFGNGPHVLGNGPHMLGKGPHVLSNGPHMLGNGPHVLGNGPHFGIMSFKIMSFGIMSHSGLQYVSFGIPSFVLMPFKIMCSGLCRSGLCHSVYCRCIDIQHFSNIKFKLIFIKKNYLKSMFFFALMKVVGGLDGYLNKLSHERPNIIVEINFSLNLEHIQIFLQLFESYLIAVFKLTVLCGFLLDGVVGQMNELVRTVFCGKFKTRGSYIADRVEVG